MPKIFVKLTLFSQLKANKSVKSFNIVVITLFLPYLSGIIVNFASDMKKLILAFMALIFMCAPAATAQSSLGDILGALGGNRDNNGSSATDAISGLISGLTGGKKLTQADVAGVWKYREPAVTFESDNLLKKAGGAAMAAVIVNKIKPYYDRVNLSQLQVTLNPDSTFQFVLGRLKLGGTFVHSTAQPDGNFFTFKFQALGKIGIGQIDAELQKTGNRLSMTFDADKLIALLNTVAKLTGRKSIQAAATLLNSYEGLNCGFALDKIADVQGAGTSAPQNTGSSQNADSTAGTQQGLGGLLDMLKRRQ